MARKKTVIELREEAQRLLNEAREMEKENLKNLGAIALKFLKNEIDLEAFRNKSQEMGY
jgi:PP-loop superfamily ATP-utilizing enzyme